LQKAGWEDYGIHGIYYLRKINIDLKRVMNFDVF
jgi:hypothetical protein